MAEVSIDFYTKTREAWQSMLADIRSAKHSVDIEQYIFAVDSIGRQFIELFRQKTKEGVKIRLLCDTVGSYSFYQSLLPDFLREQGIEVRFFNPISPWRVTNFTSNFFRDHRKMMVIDGEIAHLGGVNVQENMAGWRDTNIRVVGPLVENIKRNFEDVWRSVHKGFYIRFSPQTLVKKYDVLTNSPSLRQRFMYHALLDKMHNAKKYMYLTTPYFVPDVPFFRALKAAVKRGVDVRLLLPKIADQVFVNHARESYFTLVLKAGVRIFVYEPAMMHAKTAVIDDEWATVGTFNYDNLSFYFNHEVNVASTETVFINQVKNHFLDDAKMSHEITFEEWVRRPWRKKFLELLTWPFHWVM